ncbi:MAG: CorA family divalent cation transporter, partial [Gammaproteobacteria bacterium]|nr:CorA family divalent cation transporter [Gammaproteobacteria bacterium]
YGMNFDRDASRWSMPELGWAWGYPFSLGLIAATAAGLLYYFRRQGWFGGRTRTGQGERTGPGAGSGAGSAGA